MVYIVHELSNNCCQDKIIGPHIDSPSTGAVVDRVQNHEAKHKKISVLGWKNVCKKICKIKYQFVASKCGVPLRPMPILKIPKMSDLCEKHATGII